MRKEERETIMKKALVICLCIAMLLPLLACGAKTASSASAAQSQTAAASTAASSTASASASAAASSQAAGSSDAPVSLSVVLINGYEFWQDALKDYSTQHPNVKLDVQVMDTDSYRTIIKTKLASNDAPDILPIFADADNYAYYDNGYLADLSDMTDTISRLNKGAIDSFVMKDGGVLGIPYVQQFLLAYYNKDMFQKYNLTVPTTWEDFLKCCDTLKKAGVVPISQGNKDTWVLQMIPYSLNATSVQAADPSFYKGTADGTNKFADNAGWLDTLTKYEQLYKSGYINDGSLSMTSDQMYEMFISQKAAMTVTGTWGDTNIFTTNPSFTVGGFPIPAEGGNKGVSVSITGGLGISKSSKNITAAKEVLKYMLSKEVLDKYGSTLNTCYSDTNTTVSDAVKEAAADMSGIQGYQFDNTYFANGVQEAMFASLQEMIGGTKTPAQVLEDMDQATAKANK
jgi:raffinose/stachyose/melibiose transport system substrate-binding protein